jgi:PAS domain S-box-containing protein
MKRRPLEELSKEELIRELRKLAIADDRFSATVDEPDRERLIHDLHVHQVELEMQNRELRETQQRLEAATARYVDLYDFAPVGYCTLTPDGFIREINLTGAALLQTPREELIDRSFSSVCPLEDRQSFQAHLRRCIEEKTRVTSELTFALRRGGSRVVQMVSEPVRDTCGGAPGCRTNLIDISEFKQLEVKLRLLPEAGERFALSRDDKSTLEAAANMAVPALADLCMIDMQVEADRMERLVVFADPDKQQALADAMMQSTPRPGWQTPQARVIASGEPMLLSEVSDQLCERIAYDDREADSMRAAGIRSLMVVPLFARGRTFGALTLAAAESDRHFTSLDLYLAQDMASRAAMAVDNARLFAKAQRAITARDATLALVSHDLQNPLGAILLRTSLMMEKLSDKHMPVENGEAIKSIRRSAERMSRLIQDLLDVSSIEAGRFSVERSRQPVGPLVREALEPLQIHAAAKSLRLESDFPAGDGFDVECDGDRVQQVFSNLIGNAIKFTGAGGHVTVRVEPHENEVHFLVMDTGPGIPPCHLPHVFDRFWQAQKMGRMGTGLGLSITKGIVEAHGGRCWAESQVGVGSTFIFTLPFARPETEEASELMPTTAPRNM